MDAPRPRAAVEAPAGWAPARILLVQLERLGYRVERRVDMGTGENLLIIS